MMIFFCFKEDVVITMPRGDNRIYRYDFKGIQEYIDDTDKIHIPLNKIYFSTPSDFQRHRTSLEKIDQLEILAALPADSISSMKKFPIHLGFGNLKEKIEPLLGKDKIRILIANAMSNALGDHLIGMTALNIFYNRITKIVDPNKLEINLFQLDPKRMLSITKQRKKTYNKVFSLPNNVETLLSHDALLDLGALLLYDNFDEQPLIDFFLEALSIDKNSVSPSEKRIKYKLNKLSKKRIDKVFKKVIKNNNKPTVLFHSKSTTPIRSISNQTASKMIAEIAKKTNWNIVSALKLNFNHPNFFDISEYSKNIDDFASIVAKVDKIITVDTFTYHLADAFNTPSVVLFSSIEPEKRIKYYPYVKGIMLEKKGGMLYGNHKFFGPTEKKTKELEKSKLEYIKNLWNRVEIPQVIDLLHSIKK